MSLTKRDEDILRHIGLYRITLRVVLSKLFFEGKDPGNVIYRLNQDGWIQTHDGLIGNLSHYQLTAQAAHYLGLPENRARPIGPQAIHSTLAALWFCCMTKEERIRLEPHDLAEMIDHPMPGGKQACYCVQATEPGKIYRLQISSPNSDIKNVVKTVRKYVQDAQKVDELQPYIERHILGIAVLTPTQSRTQAVMHALRKAKLTEAMHMIGEQVPSHDSLHRSIQSLSSKD